MIFIIQQNHSVARKDTHYFKIQDKYIPNKHTLSLSKQQNPLYKNGTIEIDLILIILVPNPRLIARHIPILFHR